MQKKFAPLLTRALVSTTTGGLLSSVLFSAHALTIPNSPLGVSTSAAPSTMLVVGRDHKLFYEAYNDASDLNEDGVLDIRFNPSITYYGLFDSSLCYTYNGTHDAATSTSNSGLFSPSATAGTGGTCSSAWSGNFLNYLTTSRIDALRKVLYGGYREVDTQTSTILRRAYIPQDAHSWAKEYTSISTDGYDISKYTPLSVPTSGKRHFFGSLTPNAGASCSTLNDCSNRPPWLSVVTNSSKRVWEWASTERPVLSDSNHGGTRTNYTVRVEVCKTGYTGGCKQYPGENYKPVGLLHDYGENSAMLFGLLTGSYSKNMSGGILRKAIGSFANEINATYGTFKTGTDAPIVSTLNALRIRDFNNTVTSNAYRGGWATTAAMTEAQFVDWGNPVGEMMYEALRYYAGKGSATPAYTGTVAGTNYDAQVGLTSATWNDPYGSGTTQWCSKPNMLVVSDVNPSFDSDQLPGTAFGSFSGDLGTMNVKSIADSITSHEGSIASTSRFIGQSSLTNYDGAPTAKNVTSLGLLRGLAPEEPTKQGSYYSASVAHYGKVNDLNPIKGTQTVNSFFVALASPLPKIEFTTTTGKLVTLVPFSKSVGGDGISATKGNFQPTNQIVDFYVEAVKNTSPSNTDTSTNGGRPYAKFRINFEDVEQGADHDMDVIAEYEVSALNDGTVEVKVKPIYQAGGIRQNMGYVISGTNRDGVYLVAQDENVSTPYYLNVPPGRSAGYCDTSPMPSDCGLLPWISGTTSQSIQVFTPAASASAATLLKDPLWYAAKWGGFTDRNGNNRPDLSIEWDSDSNSTPDNYFLVQNPLKLYDALRTTFNSIIDRTSSAGNLTANTTSVTTNTLVFQSSFNSSTWSGDLAAFKYSSTGFELPAQWRAADLIPMSSARRIYTRSGGSNVEFKYSNLSTSDRSALISTDVVEYLRGDQSKEIQNGGSFRNRSKVLGDIVHSSPVYVKDSDTVFVSANDGMLHAFDATTGVERFAYVPGLVLSRLKTLSDAGYSHQFFVDGDIAVSSKSQTTDKNYLVATLGRGGKGLFALDVTSPGSFTGTSVLWEYPSATDNDMGYIIGRPVIAKTSSGTWVAIVGNGYNSTSQKAVLYVFNLTTGALLKKIDTNVAGDNGMSTPTAYDSDGDGDVDQVYAGDLNGNVWKFNASNGDPGQWDSAFKDKGKPAPLFQAKDSDNNSQPITSQITLAKNTVKGDVNEGKLFVFFGTGRYIQSTDPSNLSEQTLYGLIDDDKQISALSELMHRDFVSAGTIGGLAVRTLAQASSGDMSGKQGWYLDLLTADGIAEGERIVTSATVENFIVPTLFVTSMVPIEDVCSAGGRGYMNFLDPFSGGAARATVLDLNRDNKFDSADGVSGQAVGSYGVTAGAPSQVIRLGNRVIYGTSGSGNNGGDDDDDDDDGDDDGDPNCVSDPGLCDGNGNPGAKRTGRLSWREIIR